MPESDRNQVLDGIINYGGELIVAIENKIFDAGDLQAEADALRCARDIRSYVNEVRAENDRSPNPVPKEEVEAWAIWALRQADLVDPVRSCASLAGQSER